MTFSQLIKRPFIIVFALSFSLLVGCESLKEEPNLYGKQYLDGVMENVLEPRQTIESNAPKNYSTFAAQADKVVKGSASLRNKYSELYQNLNQWVRDSGDPATLANYGINIEQLSGADKQGNILFTGYFSPVIEMRHTPDNVFKYPVHGKIDCGRECPTRAEIYNGALDGKGLELGYAANRIDPFLMEVQGSGFVHYEDDDKLEYFAYAGKNNKAYVSLGKVLIDRGLVEKDKMSLKAIKEWAEATDEETVKELLEENPSYVFFSRSDKLDVVGSAGIPLLPLAAVAGDRSIFPMGTPILAEVPLVDDNGQWTGMHALKLLIVLDVGGAVKGGHLDLYHGMGDAAGVAAGHYKHFGRVWKLSENE